MPHITLGYTSNIKEKINFAQLLSELHVLINQLGEINIENCKSKAIKHEQFFVGSGGANKAFVYLDILILAGRNNALKQNIGTHALQLLKSYFKNSIAELDLQITVKVEDIVRETYVKFPEGTFTPMK